MIQDRRVPEGEEDRRIVRAATTVSYKGLEMSFNGTVTIFVNF
jgi:hypothetical protein